MRQTSERSEASTSSSKKKRLEKNYGGKILWLLTLIFIELSEGIDSGRWNEAKKPDNVATTALSKSVHELDFAKREAIFQKYRDEITYVMK